MTVEELEIIVKANISDVKPKIKELVREVKKAITETTEPMKKISQESKNIANSMTPSVNQIKKNMDNIKNEVKHGIEETRKIIVHNATGMLRDFDFSGKFDSLNVEELKSKMAEVETEIGKLKESMTTVDESGAMGIVSISGTEEEEKKLEELKAMHNELYQELSNRETKVSIDTVEAKSELDELNSLLDTFTKEEIEFNPSFDLLPVREQIKSIMSDISKLIPPINTFGKAFKNALNDNNSLLGMTKQKIIEFGTGIGYASSLVKNKLGEIKEGFSDVGSNIKSKLEPVTSILNKIGITGKQAFDDLKNRVGEMGSKFEKPISGIKKLISHFPKLKNESDKVKNSGKNIGNTFSKGFAKGIASLKKFALSLIGIQSIWRGVTKAASAYLSYDEELNKSFQNDWNALSSLLAPALELIASLFSKVTSYAAAFVQALTGIDLVARANAKALDKQAKSTKNASKESQSLSGIDDLNNMTTSDSSGGSGIAFEPITVEPVDSGIFDGVFAGLEKIKKIILELFEPFKSAWNNYGQGLIDSFMSGLTQIGELGVSVFTSIFEVWTNGTGEEIVGNFLILYTNLFDIVGQVAEAMTNAWNTGNVGQSIIQSIANIFVTIQGFALSIMDSLKKWTMSEHFQEMLNTVFGIIKDLVGYVETFAGWILEMYNKYLKPVIDDKLLPAIDSIIIAIGDIWKACKPVIDFIVSYIGTVLEPVIQGVCGFIGGIIEAIQGIADFVSGVFTGNWKKAWNGIKSIFKGVWDSISSIVKTPINMVLSGVEFLVNKLIDGFNSFKKALNNIGFDIPDWIPVIGGQKWGFNLQMSEQVKLPRLATGNVAKSPIVAEFGEYPGANTNPEITSPVSIMADTFRNVLSEFAEVLGGTRIDKLSIDVMGENFFDDFIEYINDLKRRKGVNVFTEV